MAARWPRAAMAKRRRWRPRLSCSASRGDRLVGALCAGTSRRLLQCISTYIVCSRVRISSQNQPFNASRLREHLRQSSKIVVPEECGYRQWKALGSSACMPTTSLLPGASWQWLSVDTGASATSRMKNPWLLSRLRLSPPRRRDRSHALITSVSDCAAFWPCCRRVTVPSVG